MSNIARRKGSSDLSSKKNVLTTKKFLGKEGEVPYIKPPSILDFVDNGRVEDIQEMESLFNNMKEGKKMLVTRRVYNDRAGKPYKYEKFLQAMATDGVKVMLIDDIEQFIADYQSGKFAINFTLDDLVAEAEKA